MSFQPVSHHTQVIIPQVTLAKINENRKEASAGVYISETTLLYFIKSDTEINIYNARIDAAERLKGNDARVFKIDPSSVADKNAVACADLQHIFTNVFNIPDEIAKKMSLSDFARTRFLTCRDGMMRDLTMDELQTALNGNENSIQIDAITFPVSGIFYGAIASGEHAKPLLKFMRKEGYTAKDFEIYTPMGKIKLGNETFKPILQRFLEKFSAFFFTASGAIGSALVAQIISASVAAGVLTFACPPLLITLLCITIGLILIGAILLFVASRIEHTVSLPQQPKQQPLA
ncbi:MAG: hypothetical protein LBB26_02435 [Puniceicoccales bacterium]|jgi:hypothetical protein|nr:hypothetical protein [Puniceicoccales bacterium]